MLDKLLQETEIRGDAKNVNDIQIEHSILMHAFKHSKNIETVSLRENQFTLESGRLIKALLGGDDDDDDDDNDDNASHGTGTTPESATGGGGGAGEGDDDDDDGAADTTPIAIGCPHTLRTLDLTDNLISPRGASKLSSAIAQNSTLLSLSLVGNPLGDEGIHSLSLALVKNRTLQNLELLDTQIGPIGAVHLANAMGNADFALQKLDVSCNPNIGDAGAEKIVRALVSSKNTSLRELNLAASKLGDECAEALANYIAGQASMSAGLTKLWVNSNEISDDGMDLLVRALKKNTRMQEFWFHGNPISVKMYIKLAELLNERAGVDGGNRY